MLGARLDQAVARLDPSTLAERRDVDQLLGAQRGEGGDVVHGGDHIIAEPAGVAGRRCTHDPGRDTPRRPGGRRGRGRHPFVRKDQTASRSLAPVSADGWRSFDMARASIWRMRSRVRLKCSPTSSSVRGSPRSRPKRSLRICALALVERREQAADLLGEERDGRGLERGLGRLVLDHVAELGVAVLAERLGQREGVGGEAHRLGDLGLGHLEVGGELGQRGRAAELGLEPAPRLLEAGQRVAGVHGEADRAARVGDAAGDGLADPPRGVRGELEALAPVELLDGVDEAEVALLDEVEQRQARGLVLLGDRHDEAEVRLHEQQLGLLAGRMARRSSRLRAAVGAAPASSASAFAATPASIACARRTSPSFVSSGYCPMSLRYRRTRSSSSRSGRCLAKGCASFVVMTDIVDR